MISVIRTQIQLTEEQYQALRESARERGTSMAEIIRESVELYLSQNGFVSGEERRQRALEVSGKFRSGLGNLAEDHDRYLEEAYSE